MHAASMSLAVDVSHPSDAHMRGMHTSVEPSSLSNMSPSSSVALTDDPARRLGPSPLGSARVSEDESQRLRRQRDMAQEEATALRMQIATLSARVDELTTAKVQLEKQLIAAQHNGSHANTPGVSPRTGVHSLEEWEKLQLRLHKAERALEQERVTVSALQRQVEAQRCAAEAGSQAAEVMGQLQADLGALQGELALKVSETESLRRALTLGDETVARLKQQLTALLHASEATLTEEQQMEMQLARTRKETGELRAALQEAAAAQKAAEARAHEAEAQAQDLVGQLGSHKGTVESLMLANAELASRVNIQSNALAMVQAECTRKDSKLQALENMLERAGAARSASGSLRGVSSDGTAAVTAVTAATTVYDGLTEEQWKLVMLVEAVQSLEVQLAALHSLGDGGKEHVIAIPDGGAPPSVPDLSLPVAKLRLRIAELARRMLELEEQLERESQARGRSEAAGQLPAVGKPTGPHATGQLASQGTAAAAVGSGGTAGAMPMAQHAPGAPMPSSSSGQPQLMTAPGPQHMQGRMVHGSTSAATTHNELPPGSSVIAVQPPPSSAQPAADLSQPPPPRVIMPFAPQPPAQQPQQPTPSQAPPAMAAPPTMAAPIPPLPTTSHHLHSPPASVPIVIHGSPGPSTSYATTSSHVPHPNQATASNHVYEDSADLDDDLPVRIQPKSKRRGGGSAVVVNDPKRGLWGWLGGSEQGGKLMSTL